MSHSSRRQLKRSRLINASINQSLSNSVTGYTPLVSREDYLSFDSRSVLSRLYGSSPRNFVAALARGGKDSLTLLVALAKLREFYPIPFTVEAFTLDMGAAEGRGPWRTAPNWSGSWAGCPPPRRP